MNRLPKKVGISTTEDTSEMKFDKTIILHGMCYSGKTTCGAILAKKLGLPFLDSRDLFMKTYNITELEYLEKYGRELFCEAEEKSIQKDMGSIVLSLGGSACYYSSTMDAITAKHTVVWLDAPFDVISHRKKSEGKQRPIVFPAGIETFEELYNQRKVLYEKYSTCRVSIEASQTPDDTVNTIIKHILRK